MMLEGSEPFSGALLVAFSVKVHSGPSSRKPVRLLLADSFQSLVRNRLCPAASIQSSFGPGTTSTLHTLLVEKVGRASGLTLRPAFPFPLPTGMICPALSAWPSMPPTPAWWKVERDPSQGGVSIPPATAM